MSVFTQFVGGSARVWVSGTSYLVGDVVLSPVNNHQPYVRITNGAGATDPSSDTTNYRPYGNLVIKSVQNGYISSLSPATGSGEDERHYNITISSVDVNKSIVFVNGGFNSSLTSAAAYNDSRIVFGRLTSSTNLRLSNGSASLAQIVARWYVLEFY